VKNGVPTGQHGGRTMRSTTYFVAVGTASHERVTRPESMGPAVSQRPALHAV